MGTSKPATPIIDKLRSIPDASNLTKSGHIDYEATFTKAMETNFKDLTQAVADGKIDEADVKKLETAITSANQLSSNVSKIRLEVKPNTGKIGEFVPTNTANRQQSEYEERLTRDPDYASTRSALEELATRTMELTKYTEKMPSEDFKALPERERAFALFADRLRFALSYMPKSDEKK
jgi:uncharacterized phage infection (PIP) family protein YhgE